MNKLAQVLNVMKGTNVHKTTNLVITITDNRYDGQIINAVLIAKEKDTGWLKGFLEGENTVEEVMAIAEYAIVYDEPHIHIPGLPGDVDMEALIPAITDENYFWLDLRSGALDKKNNIAPFTNGDYLNFKVVF